MPEKILKGFTSDLGLTQEDTPSGKNDDKFPVCASRTPSRALALPGLLSEHLFMLQLTVL